ncbi:hypothetical protein FIV42_08880 [Persicimonas caeni]|uniref:Uncharacterized protein n=1 Tax=Persicimonas caeni TaxID=2292766 RepID=A0A4Y6PR97_PERCE|nr:HmuY family protein [Persicimonas caeni]QDG50841.1 hypothetical protein FIV42_08880 [Persicimonas caeni]QED32062.1 hypothetical protein FRD00_08875 [Persicimonas caeni]
MALSLAACGGDDDNATHNATTDTGLTEDAAAAADAGGEDVADETGEDASTGEDAAACSPEDVAAAQVAQNATVNDGAVSFGADGDVQTATVEAASGGVQNAAGESFIYVDLDAAAKLELSDAEAFEDDVWDLAFRRTVIRLNSADSGPGNWMVSRIDKGWAEATQPPGTDAEWAQDDFVTDACELVTEGRDTIKTGFGTWYEYDPSTHSVSVPESTTWAMYNMSTHAVVKFGIDAYADGTYDIRWGGFE